MTRLTLTKYNVASSKKGISFFPCGFSEKPETISAMTQSRVVQVEDVVRLIVEALVDDANAVTISPIESASGIHFVIMAPQNEAGKLIGKNGRTARAFRTLLNLVGQKNREMYSIDILPIPQHSD